MSNFVIYDITTGEIVNGINCLPDQMEQNVEIGQGFIEVTAFIDDAENYVLAGVITPKPPVTASIDKTTIAPDGVDTVTVTGIPMGSHVTIKGPVSQTGTINDGVASITVNLPGTYVITIEAFPYLKWENSFVAN